MGGPRRCMISTLSINSRHYPDLSHAPLGRIIPDVLEYRTGSWLVVYFKFDSSLGA